ncbi:MAG: tyrosine-type recombinase/integrase [Phenylobacterium sp.]|nr:tyrosine-type recombinase/integrase [Phenylobacterium sp.]MDZ4317665.1 tyrosine-type recombinase/integrase [Phenylobacterium sp.]
MIKHSPKNERIKRNYFVYLREAKGRSPASIDMVAKAISRFEEATNARDFAAFHREQVVAFKRRLSDQANTRTGERLSRATVASTLRTLKAFYIWLADQPGYRSKITYVDADYFSPSEKDARIARAVREKAFPTLEQMHHVLATMASDTEIERRDRAIVALLLLTGARDGALASLRLKHLDLAAGALRQDAEDVKTKFAKTFTTYFFPVGGEAVAIIGEWAAYLRRDRLFGDNDPLFPRTLMTTGQDGGFVTAGIDRQPWTTAAPIRQLLRRAFEQAGLPYFNPHSIRDTLVQLGERTCRSPEEFKAWSQNLGHEQVLTTFTSYGTVGAHRQAELIRGLGRTDAPNRDVADLLRAALAQVGRERPAA